jgi:hypothetical protein
MTATISQRISDPMSCPDMSYPPTALTSSQLHPEPVDG